MPRDDQGRVVVPKIPPNSLGLGWFTWGTNTMFQCRLGHRARLDHVIARDGTVTPSLQCFDNTCDFHENVKLADWSP